MFKFNQLTKRVILGLSAMGLLATSQPAHAGRGAPLGWFGACLTVNTLICLLGISDSTQAGREATVGFSACSTVSMLMIGALYALRCCKDNADQAKKQTTNQAFNLAVGCCVATMAISMLGMNAFPYRV